MQFIRKESGPLHSFPFGRIVPFFLLLVSGCKEPAYFISSNELNKEKVMLYRRDQSRIPDTPTISLENFYNLDVNSAFIWSAGNYEYPKQRTGALLR